jgi:membrane-associated protease RseP (regulator of RpoE activity)
MSIRLKKFAAYLLGFCIIFLPLGGCATAKLPKVSKAEIQAEKERAQINSFQTYRRRQAKLYDVAYPLLVASTELTKKKRWSYGFVFNSLTNFERKDRKIAQRAFPKLTEGVSIVHLVEGSPAVSSELKVGDIIEEYNGKTIKKVKHLTKAFKHLKDEENPGPGKFVVLRDGERIEVSVEPKQIAGYEVNLVADQQVNAWADGSTVNFTYGIMRFTESDDELALIIGHELAHNTEGHVGKAMLKTAATALPIVALGSVAAVMTGVDVSPMAKIAMKAAQAKFSRGHEREADYVGTYITARAGYSIEGAEDFWRRFSSEIPNSMKESYDSSHPTSPERTVRMEKVCTEIEDKIAKGLTILPERK